MDSTFLGYDFMYLRTNISEESAASICRVVDLNQRLFLDYSDDQGSTLLRNVSIVIPVYMASHFITPYSNLRDISTVFLMTALP